MQLDITGVMRMRLAQRLWYVYFGESVVYVPFAPFLNVLQARCICSIVGQGLPSSHYPHQYPLSNPLTGIRCYCILLCCNTFIYCIFVLNSLGVDIYPHDWGFRPAAGTAEDLKGQGGVHSIERTTHMGQAEVDAPAPRNQENMKHGST